MGSVPWIALAVFVVLVAAGAFVAVRRGLAAYRTFRTFQRQLDTAMAETQRLIDGIEPRVARATATAQRLEEARMRLEQSAASAKLLFEAFGEAMALLRRITAFVPR